MSQFYIVLSMLAFFVIAESARLFRDQLSTEWKRQNEEISIPKNTRSDRRKYMLFPRTRAFYNNDLNNRDEMKYFESNKIISNNRTKQQLKINNKNQARAPERRSADKFQLQEKVSQFHSQDSNGKVSFGFNSPYQARFEERDNDGTVRGSYSYIDTNGKKIEVNYWDTGDGFHVQGNNFPTVNDLPKIPEFTPEVQAARDLHFRIYDEILASTNRLQNNLTISNVPVVNMQPKVTIPVQEDIRNSIGNIIVPTHIPFDDEPDKNMNYDLQFLDYLSFGDQFKNNVAQETAEKSAIRSKNSSNDFIQYSWLTKPKEVTGSTTDSTGSVSKINVNDAAIVIDSHLIEETAASASNKIAQIRNNENGKAFEKQSGKVTKINEDGKKNFGEKKSNGTSFNKEYFEDSINNTTSSEHLKIGNTPKSKSKSTTTAPTTTTTLSSPILLQKFDKIYDISNAFSDISNTNIFDWSHSLQPKVNSTSSNNDLVESHDQINNKTISKIYDLTKTTSDNIDNRQQLSSIFDDNSSGQYLPLDNINDTRLVNSRTNNSFYYHFYHPTTSTLEKQGRNNVLSELVGVTSKRLHVFSKKKPQVRPYYYFPITYP